MYRFSASLLLMLLSLFVASVQAVPVPDRLHSVGHAELRVFFMKIYRAELYSASGRYEKLQGPLMLRLTYRRDISNTRLVSETRKQIGDLPDEQLDRWMTRLANMWPNLAEGDELTFYMDPEGRGHFHHNGQYIGSLEDPVFAKAFLNIWLADDSAYPKLTRKLRGER
ncbi:chalcone isomerase family protein [uncultured Porticoccus sp.]|uniref:chalcone isomerase family protein n=1 Tax=uncultured Porticoccus sp. TaxID=1256050 RepID=UPI0026316303|nr:chalcone isomerase family protein [uncultured Porticoccus sp.]